MLCLLVCLFFNFFLFKYFSDHCVSYVFFFFFTFIHFALYPGLWKLIFSLCLVRYYDVVIKRMLLKDTLIVFVGALLFTLNQFLV